MVTPKIQYTGEQILRLISNANVIADKFRRSDEVGLRTAIRFDPDYENISANFEECLEYTDMGCFLLNLHYQQLKYAMVCMDWKFDMTYEEFGEVVIDITNQTEIPGACIIYMTFFKDGTVTGSVERTAPVRTMFDGLIEQLELVNLEKKLEGYDDRSSDDGDNEGREEGDGEEAGDDGGDNEGNIDNEGREEGDRDDEDSDDEDSDDGEPEEDDDDQLMVYVDTQATLPCQHTSFDTTDISAYFESHARVTVYYRRLLMGVILESRARRKNNNPLCDEEVFFPGEEKFEKRFLLDHIPLDKKENLESLKEVGNLVTPLLYNTGHHVMCAGFEWTVAFYRDDTWITPHLGTGCRNDPLRMLLLEFGVLKEDFILLQTIEPMEDILLISAAHGIRRGCVMGDIPPMLYKYTRSRTKNRLKRKQNGKEKEKDKPVKFHLSEYMNLNDKV